MTSRNYLVSGVTAMCMLAGAISLYGQTARDVDFTDKLNEMQLYDYAEFFLEGLLKQDLKNPDRARVLLMDTLLRQNKVNDAKAIFEKLPKDTRIKC